LKKLCMDNDIAYYPSFCCRIEINTSRFGFDGMTIR